MRQTSPNLKYLQWLALTCAGVFLIMLSGALFIQTIQARPMIADLSKEKVNIKWNFSGTEILLFGALDDQAATLQKTDIIVIVKGPEKPVTLRKKAKIKGLWLNKERAQLLAAPTFYHISSNRPLKDIADAKTLDHLKIGPASLIQSIKQSIEKTTSKTKDKNANALAFAQSFVRLMQTNKLYDVQDSGVTIQEGRLFKVAIALPGNVPVGTFDSKIFMMRDGQLISQFERQFDIQKYGAEAYIYRMAYQHPFFYGLFAVMLAAMAGYLASLIFGRN